MPRVQIGNPCRTLLCRNWTRICYQPHLSREHGPEAWGLAECQSTGVIKGTAEFFLQALSATDTGRLMINTV